MADRPSSLPQWATSGTIVEPAAGKKATGHVAAEQPPAEHFNWLFNLIYQWTQYLQDPNSMTFGASKLSTIADALTTRLTVSAAANAVSAYTLLGSFGSARVYIGAADGTPSLVFAINAVYGTAGTWTKVTSGQIALALFLRRDRAVLAMMPALQDAAWSDAFVVGAGTTSGWGRILDFSGDSSLDSVSQADIARLFQQITTTAGVERVLIHHFKHANGDVRLYYALTTSDSDAGAFEVALNAGYSNNLNTWSHDVTGIASKLVIARTRMAFKWKASAAAGTTFADSAWSSTPLNFVWQTAASGAGDENQYGLGNGRIHFSGVQTAGANDANPPAQVASLPANSLHAANIPKAWGLIQTGASPSVLDGYNLDSVTPISFTGSDATIHLETPMADSNFDVNITLRGASGGPARVAHVVSRGTDSVRISAFEITVASPAVCTQINLSSTTVEVMFSIHAKQTT